MQTFTPHTYSIITRGEGMTLKCPEQYGYVYLIHLERPYVHARHYLGSSGPNLEGRLHLHRTNQGARLLEVVNDADIPWHVSRIWQTESPAAARILEAKLKRQHSDLRLCPECMGRTPDPLAMLYQGHQVFSLFDKPGRRQPMREVRYV